MKTTIVPFALNNPFGKANAEALAMHRGGKNRKRLSIRVVLLIACSLLLAGSASGAGVTVIAHGYQVADSGLDPWVPAMANAISNRIGGASGVSQYSLILGRNASGQAAILAFTRDAGSPSFDTLVNSEAIVKVDWSDLDGGDFILCAAVVPTGDIAQLVFDALINSADLALDPSLKQSLCELPVHLIGHSRGASVMSEVSRLLGRQGIWVDQLTLLDPHPIYHCGDAGLDIWENVLFADNYYEDFLLTAPGGETVGGAYNRRLTSLPGGYGDAGSGNHSDVHLWYQGTTDTNPTAFDGNISLTPAMRADWYASGETQGQTAGFHYSRLGGGDRTSSAQPAGDGTPIFSGYNLNIFYGNDQYLNRMRINDSDREPNQWPNIITLTHSAASLPVAVGRPVNLQVQFQSYDWPSEVDFFLDPDANPHNGNETVCTATLHLTATGSEITAANANWNTMGYPLGTYRVYARVLSSPQAPYAVKTRYFYAAQAVTIAPAGGGGQTLLAAPTLISPPDTSIGQSTTPSFGWSAVNGASSYRILVAVDPSALPTNPTDGDCPDCVVNATTTSTTYTLNSRVLIPGTPYYWQVHARSPEHFGTWSSVSSFTTVSGITWTGGAGDGDWYNRTNWNPKIVPSSYDYVIINSGTVYVPVNFVFQKLTLNGGTLQNSFSINGNMNWTGGTLGNIGALTISPTSVLNITGTAAKGLTRMINNAGTLVFGGTGYLGAESTAAVINNLAGGVFDHQSDASINYYSSDPDLTINNAGTYLKSGGTGTSTFRNVRFNNAGSIQVQSGKLAFTGSSFLQTAGTTSLNGGSLASTTPISIQGGSLIGNGMVFGSVVNNGTIAPGFSAGKLSISNSLTAGTNSTIELQLGGYAPGTQYDVLAAGNAALDGTLSITFIDGFQNLITNSARFTICTASPLSGLFKNVPNGGRLASSDGFAEFIVSYGPNSLVLTVVSVNAPVKPIGRRIGNDFVISFSGALGRTYRLERKDDLADPDWIMVGDVVGNGSTGQAADLGGATQPKRFYRIRLLP